LLAQAEGKGIGYEAALAARAYAAQHLGHDGVISYIDPTNPRSETLARRLGAVIERQTVFFGKQANIWRHPKEAT
jgi:RimJ/RimL family protein N-acetyltransferase